MSDSFTVQVMKWFLQDFTVSVLNDALCFEDMLTIWTVNWVLGYKTGRDHFILSWARLSLTITCSLALTVYSGEYKCAMLDCTEMKSTF